MCPFFSISVHMLATTIDFLLVVDVLILIGGCAPGKIIFSASLATSYHSGHLEQKSKPTYAGYFELSQWNTNRTQTL